MKARRRSPLASGRAGEWVVALQAWVLLPLISLALRLLPLPRVQELLLAGRSVPAEEEAASRAVDVARLRWLVAAAAHRLPFTPRCLPRSLCLQHLLARRGVAAELRIGVRRDGGRLAAHAWLEVDGSPVGEPEDVSLRFLPLDRVDHQTGDDQPPA